MIWDKYRHLVFTIFFREKEFVENALTRILGNDERYQVSTETLDLALVYENEPPAGGAHMKKIALFSTKNYSNATVFMSNCCDGWQTLTHYLNKELKSDSISISSTTLSAQYPINSFSFHHSDGDIRLVRVMKDTTWNYFEEGELLGFENPNYYKEEFIKNRMNREIIIEYLNKMGFNTTSDQFWETDGAATYFQQLKH